MPFHGIGGIDTPHLDDSLKKLSSQLKTLSFNPQHITFAHISYSTSCFYNLLKHVENDLRSIEISNDLKISQKSLTTRY